MAAVEISKFDVNKFWDKTPTPLKYFIMVAVIVVGSYYAFSKVVSIGQIKELNKMEESITTTRNLVDQFQEFEKKQMQFNDVTLTYLKNIHMLIKELDDNTNKKFDMVVKAGGKNTDVIIDKLQIMNESFQKLQKAYIPTEPTPFPETKIIIQPIK